MAVLTAFLIALAGCGGGPAGDATTTPGATTPDATTAGTTGAGAPADTTGQTTDQTTAGASTTAAQSTSNPQTTSGPAGDAETLSPDAAMRNREALQAAGSATISERLRYGNATQVLFNTTNRYRLDLAGDRGFARSGGVFAGFGGTTERYTAGDTTWVRSTVAFGNQTQVQYRMGTEPYAGEVSPVNLTTAVGGTSTTESNATFRRVGTETFNGTQVTRYEADDESMVSVTNDTGVSGQNLSVVEANASVLVDQDGIMRLLTYDVVFETQNGEQTVTLSYRRHVYAVGSTQVSEPAWLEEARAQTGTTSGGNAST